MQQISQGTDSLAQTQNIQALGSLNWKLDQQNTEVTQKNKQPYEKEISRLIDSSLYLKNRVSCSFNYNIQVKQTQSYLIDDISSKVDSLFKKFNLSQNNVDYMNDQLKRLNDRVNQERQKKQQQFQSSIKIEDYKNFQTIQQEYSKNKQIFQSINKIELKSQTRQKEKLTEILSISHRAEKQVTHEIQLNQYNQVILEKLFIDNHLYIDLLNFLKNKSNPANYEKLFRTLENFETTHNFEMRLLADQFKNIEPSMNSMQKCERIIRNTVIHLENEMLKQIGHLDLQNLNRKFKEFYLPYFQDIELYQIGQFYPSGILFLLMRIGKVNEAQKLLDPLLQNNHKIASQFYSFFQLSQQEKINQNDVEEKSRLQRSDLLLQQCFFLLLDVSEAFTVFEENKFVKDQNLYIWLVLKTTHSSEEFVDYERNPVESFKTFFHWNLLDLHETIPQSSVSLKMNLILQRYDYVLNEFYKQNNACLAQVEYFILDLIITTLQIKSEGSITFSRQKQYIVDNLVSQTQNKHPLIACLILSVYSYDLEQVANILQKGNHITKVLSDKAVKENLEVIFGKDEFRKIQIEMVTIYFRNNLHNALKELQQSLEKSTTITQINECQVKLSTKLEEMSTYIKQLIKLQDDKIETALYLYHETQFVQIISLVIVNQFSALKFGAFLDKRQYTIRSQDEMHSLMKSKANNQEFCSYLYRFQLIEIFQKAYISQRSDQMILNEINSILSNIKIKEITKSLILEQQVDLIKMVFWQILQLLDLKKNQEKTFIIQKIKELNETLLKSPERQGIQICEKNVEFSQIVVEILNTYSRNLKIY